MQNFPSIFVSHGAPTLVVDQNPAHDFLKGLGDRLGKPRAILIISAHWMTQIPTLSLAEKPSTIYDFGGFPEFMYTLKYPAPGAPDLARRAATLLQSSGIEVALHPDRGLDHGAWVPLMLMYPDADIPVVQLSIQPGRSPLEHWLMGEALRPLTHEGILIVGSGSATHNLREISFAPGNAPPPEHVTRFEHWLVEAVAERNQDELVHYLEKAPQALRSHPTNDHYYPLLVAAGAGDERGGEVLHRSMTFGVLAMDAFSFPITAA